MPTLEPGEQFPPPQNTRSQESRRGYSPKQNQVAITRNTHQSKQEKFHYYQSVQSASSTLYTECQVQCMDSIYQLPLPLATVWI